MFGIITDTHLRGKDWTDKTSVLNDIKRQMADRGVKVIINLGDLFDNYGRLNDKYITTNSVSAFLNNWLSSQDVTLVSIEGNHDQSGQESAYDIFSHPNQIVVKNRVSWVSIENNYFICVPWLTNNRVGGVDARMYAKEMIKECYNDVIASAKRTGSRVESLNLVGHLDAVGAKIRDHVSITSEEYSKYCFDFEVLINDVGYLDNIFLGHIHYRQPVKARGEGYYGYIGYVAPLGHGELENPNGWVYFDGKNIEFVDVEAPKYYQVHTQDLIDNVGNFKHWDRVRVIGTPTIELPTKHVEVLGEKLESNAVREYIENKNTSLKDIYTKWLSLVGVTPKDPDAVLAYLDGLNIRWESLTGKLSKIHSIEIENIGPHKYFKHEFASGVTTILGKNGAGKAQPHDCKVMTPYGYTRMGDICVGDTILTPYGDTTTVVSVHPQGIVPTYKITFTDDSSTLCCKDHLWLVANVLKKPDSYVVKSTLQLLDVYKSKADAGYLRYRIPMTIPVAYAAVEVSIDPYVLGAILGNGCLTKPNGINFTTRDTHIIQKMNVGMPVGVGVHPNRLKDGLTYTISSGTKCKGSKHGRNTILNELKSLNLMGKSSKDKFVPDTYKYNSVQVRISVLQGLLDTDGHPCGGAGIEYVSASLKLMRDVQWLVQSLGGTCRIGKSKVVKGVTYLRSYIKLPFNIFSLPRKRDKWVAPTKYPVTRIIKSIDKVDDCESTCISVSDPRNMYLTDEFIVTHNTWILESFPYCVFGDWPTRRGSASSYMMRDSKLTVKFDIEGTVYYAVRTEKGLTAYDKDMKDLTGKLKRSSKEWFEERLGEKDNFLHCCFSDQKSFNDLIDCDPSSRMHMLRAFLKLDIFDAYHEEIKNNLAATKAKYDQYYEKGSGLGESMLELEEAKREYAEVSEEYNYHAPKSKSLVDRFHECHTAQLKLMEYENMEHKVASLSQDLAKADDQVVQMETLIAKLKKPLTNAECNDIKYKISELKDKRRNIYDVQNRIKDLKSKVYRLDLSKVGCSPNHLSCILINDVVEAKKELDSLVDTSGELPSISNEIEKCERMLTSNNMLVNELTSNTYKLDMLKKNKENVLSQFLKAKDLLESKEKPVIPGNIEQVQELYNQYHDHELKLVRKQAQLESRIDVLNKTIVEKNNIVTNVLPSLELQLDTLTVLEKAFSKYGIPHYMASSALPELQEIFNSLLKVSFEDRLHIVFDNISDPTSKKIKENFSIIKMNARRPHDVRYSSPGEQSILKTLWKLTLLTFQARRNEGYRVLFLDEPTTSQDADNVEATMRVLHYVSGFFDQVIMVTHDAQLAELADNKIVLE